MIDNSKKYDKITLLINESGVIRRKNYINVKLSMRFMILFVLEDYDLIYEFHNFDLNDVLLIKLNDKLIYENI